MPAFLCHFYNTYFAHSAGGKMIGTKLSAVLLDRHKLHFYQYEGGERADKPLLQACLQTIGRLFGPPSRGHRVVCNGQSQSTFNANERQGLKAQRRRQKMLSRRSGVGVKRGS